jgi:hypothetical protein
MPACSPYLALQEARGQAVLTVNACLVLTCEAVWYRRWHLEQAEFD